MIGKFSNIEVRGIVTTVPNQIETNDRYVEILGEQRVKKQARITGIQKRHIDKWSQTTADLCITSAKKLLKDLAWGPDEIRVLVMVTQHPSLIMPSSAFIVQKYLGINHDCIVFDVNLGCSGFVSGIHIVSSLLQSYGVGAKGLLLTGDIQRNPYRRKPDTKEEFADQMLFGSAGSVTALENVEGVGTIWFDEKTDGTRYSVISQHFDEKSVMDGEAVFEFAVNDVTDYINAFFAELKKQNAVSPDYYVFHQAQQFMLQNVASICGIEQEKMLYSLKEYGNTSSASIPLTLCFNKDLLKPKNVQNIFLCGFGIGLSCALMQLSVKSDIVLEILESDEEYKY